MEEIKLSEEQERARREELARGEAFELMLTTKGWGFVKGYYENRIKRLASSLLLQDDKQIEEFENERRELIGIRKLLGHIDSAVNTLNEQREKDKGITE